MLTIRLLQSAKHRDFTLAMKAEESLVCVGGGVLEVIAKVLCAKEVDFESVTRCYLPFLLEVKSVRDRIHPERGLLVEQTRRN